jgi:hypothetical protein
LRRSFFAFDLLAWRRGIFPVTHGSLLGSDGSELHAGIRYTCVIDAINRIPFHLHKT